MTDTDTTADPTAGDPTRPRLVWPCFTYADARAAITFLVDVVGFELAASYPPEGDVVDHAQLRWPEGGGVMLGSYQRNDREFCQRPPGGSSTYVVTDDPDAVYARTTAAGAELVQDLREEDYGSRGFSIRDPEGNIWSFGTYRGE